MITLCIVHLKHDLLQFGIVIYEAQDAVEIAWMCNSLLGLALAHVRAHLGHLLEVLRVLFNQSARLRANLLGALFDELGLAAFTRVLLALTGSLLRYRLDTRRHFV